MPDSMTARGVAFFDLDRTLLDCNSGRLYVQNERRERRLSNTQLAVSMVWFGLYHLSLLDVDRAYRKAADQWRGVNARELKARVDAWFERDVTHRLRPGARRALSHHRGLGHALVLLTNSSDYVAEAAAKAFALDAYLANPLLEDGRGQLSGELEAPLCYGHGKVTRARRWAEAHGLSLDAAHFYTDSYSDLPMLEAVPNPVVVHPDPKLRREAQRRGWPVVDWSM